MNIKELSDSIKKLKVDQETKDAILEIIEQKINNDMYTFNEKISTLSEELKRTEKSLENKIGSIKWVLGIGFTILSILLAIIALK